MYLVRQHILRCAQLKPSVHYLLFQFAKKNDQPFQVVEICWKFDLFFLKFDF